MLNTDSTSRASRALDWLAFADTTRAKFARGLLISLPSIALMLLLGDWQ